MTTAARPTFDTAKGGSSRSEKSLSSHSKQYSARDLPSHTKLKYRQQGQGNDDDLKNRDFRRELEERELKAKQIREGKRDWELESPDIVEPKKLRVEDFAKLDADEKLDFADNEDEDEDVSDDSDEEDDTEALLAELNKIKKERAAEEARKQEQREAEENKVRVEAIMGGNPLYNPGSSSSNFTVKRRWDDDVVFKNCAKGEVKEEKRGFINDTLRSEFHKKFMDRYIK